MMEKLRIFFIDALSRGKHAIIPGDDGGRGPYALPRRPDAHGTPILRRTAAPESCGHSGFSRPGRHRRREPRSHVLRRPAVRRVAGATPRTGGSRSVNTARNAAAEAASVQRRGRSGPPEDLIECAMNSTV